VVGQIVDSMMSTYKSCIHIVYLIFIRNLFLNRICKWVWMCLHGHHGSFDLNQPLLQMAGKDISHWFEPRTADMTTGVELLMEFDPQMQITTYCIPPKVGTIFVQYSNTNQNVIMYCKLTTISISCKNLCMQLQSS